MKTLLLALSLFLASAGSVEKYAGTGVTVLYLAVLLIAVPVLRSAASRLRISTQVAFVLSVVGWLAFALLLVYIYPRANVHLFDHGSDRDDAADLGARRLLDLHYPYGEYTYLGLPVAQLPGALLFAAPFAVVGSAYAALVWLPVLFELLRRIAHSISVPLILVGGAFLLSPGLPREWLVGGDLASNTVYVMAAVFLVLAAERQSTRLAAAVLLGVTLASRANFPLILAPVAVSLWRQRGRATTVATLGTVGATTGALLAFVFARASGRESLRITNHLSSLDHWFPGAAALLVVAGAAAAVAMALRARSLPAATVFGQAALIQAVFPVALVVSDSARGVRLSFDALVTGYGVPQLVLALAWFAGQSRPAAGGAHARGRNQGGR